MGRIFLVGVGERGRKIVGDAKKQVKHGFSKRFRTVGLFVPPRAKIEREGVIVPPEKLPTVESFEEDVLFPCEVEGELSQEALVAAFRGREEEFLEKCAPIVRELLTEEERADLLCFFFVASLTEPIGAFVTKEAAAVLGNYVRETYPGQALRVEGLFLVPEGKCPEGPMICQFLKGLEGESPFDFAYLLSPVNSRGVRLKDEQMEEMAAWFVVLMVSTDLTDKLRREEMGFGTRSRMGTFGLSFFEFPAEHLIHVNSVQVARKLVEEGLLRSDLHSEEMRGRARKFASEHNLEPGKEEKLVGELLVEETARGRESLEDELKVGSFLFREVPMSKWPTALATFDAFFRRERLGLVLTKAEQRALSWQNEIFKALKRETDLVVEGNSDPQNAFAFLAELNHLVRGLREHFQTVYLVREKKTPSVPKGGLEEKLEELRKAISKIPTWEAVILRAVLFGVLAALPLQVVLQWIAEFKLGWLSWLTAPMQWLLALLLAVAPFLVAGWHTIYKTVKEAQNKAEECRSFMESSYKATLLGRVYELLSNILNRLFLLTLDSETLEREFPDYKGENEWKTVERFKGVLQALPNALVMEERLGAPWRLDACKYARNPVEFHYRNDSDFSDWVGESKRFVEKGLYRGWRQLDVRELTRRLLDFTKEGFEYIREITLDTFVKKYVLPSEEFERGQFITKISNNLHRLSTPYLLLKEAPDDVPFNFVLTFTDWDITEEMRRHTHLGEDIREVGTLDPPNKHLFGFLKIADYVRLEMVKALPLWCETGGGGRTDD